MNLILCLVSVLITTFLIDKFSSPLLPFTIFTVLCFAGASNILNDVLDVNIDSVNRP
ncbi:uncharacterized protein METZ01_LOCUS501519, partial [marine metagenome]